MSEYTKCPVCGDYDFRATHKCATKWKVFHKEWMDDEFDEFEVIYAYSNQAAAKKYAEEHESNCCEFPLMNGGKLEVQVEPFDGGERKTFVVTGELTPTYYAKEKK